MTSTTPGTKPGLQRERTVLAWHRFGLAQLALGLTLPRLANGHLTPLVITLSGAIAALALTIIHLSSKRRFAARSGLARPSTDGLLPLLAATSAQLTWLAVITGSITGT